AVVSAVASAIGLVVNGRQKRRLEENKAESSRILEMIKTPDTEAAAQNLEFLIDSGLVASPEQVKRLREYLKERKFGTGPSLPANSDFDFEPSEGLTLVLQEDLERNLTRYIEYLDKIGLSRREEKAKIKIDELDPANAHYNSETRTLTIDSRIANDPFVALREYGHHVLFGDRLKDSSQDHDGIES